MPDENARSLATIELADLLRLAELGEAAEGELFQRNPRGSSRYAGRPPRWRGTQDFGHSKFGRYQVVLIAPRDRAGEIVWPADMPTL